MAIFPKKSISNTGTISVSDLGGNFVRTLINAILDQKDAGRTDVKLDFSKLHQGPVWPHNIVPIAAFIDQLKEEENMSFTAISPHSYLEHTNFLDPLAPGFTSQSPTVLNRVWKFSSSEDVFKLVTEYIDEIYKSDVVEGENVLKALEWSLNEVMDNVIQHAETNSGFVMGQIHPTSKHVAFCIADYGRGILNSLRSSPDVNFRVSNAEDALTLALQEGVTRDKSVGQGNGLWGLKGFSTQSSGQLRLSSDGKTIDLSHADQVDFHPYPRLSRVGGGTVVDFQIDYTKPILLDAFLGGYDPASLKLIKLSDGSGTLNYKLIDQKSGFGTRKSGERIRNEVINLQKTGDFVNIDFAGVNVISSSFADELVGKLYAMYGPLGFSNYFKLLNMNDFVEPLVNKAVVQRLNTEFNS
ncbi:MAG: STAS-like domain-containing protein [Candidatus Saccharimonadales bacterium]